MRRRLPPRVTVGQPILIADKMYREYNTKTHLTSNLDIRFTGSVAVQQKTDGIEAAVRYVRKVVYHASKSRSHALLYLLATFVVSWLLSSLLSTPASGPVPDLIKVAGLAKSFEPVIYYSQAGHE